MSTVAVKALASASEADRPLAFVYAGQRYRVAQVIRRDRTPQHLVFIVRCSTGAAFRLTYHLSSADWQIYPLHEEAP